VILCSLLPIVVQICVQNEGVEDIDRILVWVYVGEFIFFKMCEESLLNEHVISEKKRIRCFENRRNMVKKRKNSVEEGLRSWIESEQLVKEILVWTDGAIEYEEKYDFMWKNRNLIY